jgi:hypothetical protein
MGMKLSDNAKKKLASIGKTAIEVEKLNNQYSQSGVFKFFQLRPKEGGIQIISLLPSHPMRGGDDLTAEDADRKISAIATKIAAFGGDAFLPSADLAALGFHKRQNDTDTYREDDVQAAFSLQMLSGGEQFDGIKLVATEFLMAGANKRVDVLGVKDSTLYVFELKRKRYNSTYAQAARYRDELKDNIEDYIELLRHYPNMASVKITDVAAVAVMPWANGHRLTKLYNVGHWLYNVPKDYNFSAPLTFGEKRI